MTPDTDMISRVEADRQTQEAVAAVLMEAARIARAAPDGEIACDDILALTPEAADRIEELEDKLAQADAMVAAALERASAEIAPLLSSALAAKQQAHTMDYEQAMGERADGLELALRRIRALITDDAQTALTKMLAGAKAEGMREAAEICTRVIRDYDVMKPNGTTYEPLRVQRAAKSMVSLAREDILAAADAIQKEGGA